MASSWTPRRFGQLPEATWAKVGKVAAIAGPLTAGLIVVLLLIYRLLPPGIDYYHYFSPIPRDWLAGHTRLYDEASRGFYNPPWALWLLLPLSLLPVRMGMAVLTLISIAVTSAVVLWAVGRRRAWLVAPWVVLCPYSLQMLFAGQLDAFSLLGVCLGVWSARTRQPWTLGVALLLTTVKPQNGVLIVPALLLSIRGWTLRDLAQLSALPMLVLVATLVAFGLDWPVRWWQSLQAAPPIPYLVTSTYHALGLLGVPRAPVVAVAVLLSSVVLALVWRRGLSREMLGITMATNAIVTPYMLSQSYILLLAIPWASLAARRPLMAALPYALGLSIFLRPRYWDSLGLVDVWFPVLLLTMMAVDQRIGLGRMEPND